MKKIILEIVGLVILTLTISLNVSALSDNSVVNSDSSDIITMTDKSDVIAKTDLSDVIAMNVANAEDGGGGGRTCRKSAGNGPPFWKRYCNTCQLKFMKTNGPTGSC